MMLKNKDNLYGQMLYDLTAGQTDKDLTLRLAAFAEFLSVRQESYRLNKILKAYETIYDKKQGITRAELSTKKSLSGKDRGSLIKQLTEKIGGQIEYKEIIDPDMVGGVKIKIGDQIIDGSFRSAIDQLARVF